MTDYRCLACNGEGLASSATVEAQQKRIDDAVADALEHERRWRLAAEAVLGKVKIQDQPALEFIDKLMSLGERITA